MFAHNEPPPAPAHHEEAEQQLDDLPNPWIVY